MKKIILLLLFSGCTINRWVDRIEISSDQIWDLYTELHVIKVDSCRHFRKITAVPYGKPYPKYTYQWEDYSHTVSVGDLVPLTDSLRSHIDYRHHWKRYDTK
ncbi:MAG: hypothetical protein A2Y87_02135 [Bacteroidetes bacterium RBG_13_46_8]|nr:MAG: hypothetical protein A2Y87_02135 [Bacteroidetes bacterium RBG_13_46_8]